jgi:hypothetical protein
MLESKYPKFFDLTLLISPLDNTSYPVLAYSERLRKKCTASLPHAEVVELLIPRAEQLHQSPLPLESLKDFGRCMFEALMRDRVRDMLRTLEGQNADGLNLYLVLDLPDHDLQRLPWECMFDPYHEYFLSLQDNMHIIRKVQRTPEAAPDKAARGYSNLVIAIANPRDQPPLNPQRERELIDLAVGDLHQSGLLDRRYIQGSQQEMCQALALVPNVFHFVGHGGIEHDKPGLYLEDPNGDARFVDATKLVNEYFTPPPGTESHVNLVILSACQTSATPKTEGYSSLAYELVSRAQVDTVLAMQYPIGLDNLTEFNGALYGALAKGVPLETAVNVARRKIVSAKPGGARDWISPVLTTRHDAPSKLLQLISQNPFKGPIHYDQDDRERFFGRDHELEKLVALDQKQRVVVIRGDCGCGKTSLLKAGWMPGLIRSQKPLVYISLSEDLEAQLRLEINNLLVQAERLPLPEGELAQLTGHFPRDLTIVLDRVEQIEFLSEQVDQIVAALIQWALDPAQPRPRSCLLIATRLNERGEEPGLLQQRLPEAQYPRLDLEMLDQDQARLSIEATTRKSDITFLPETIRAILDGLKYHQPEERNMMALQVVCRAVYQHALDLQRTEVTPELLCALNRVDGILDREFAVATKLKQSMYKGGDAARKVLSQFVCSDKRSMRPRSWNELLLRCCADEHELSKILDILQVDGLVRLEQHPGGEKYELVHETLIRQMEWLEDTDLKLRQLEEIVESAHTIIPLRSEKGGLEDLDALRDALTLSEAQQALLLRSALEAGHETDYWFKRIQAPQLALSVLTSPYLGVEAQERACAFLGMLGSQPGESGDNARETLWEWAYASKLPRINQAASLALAPLVDAAFIEQKYGAGDAGKKHAMSDALALMYDVHRLPLKDLPAAARRQVRLKLLRNNALEILSAALRAAGVGAAGLGLAVVWNYYAQAYLTIGTQNLPAFTILTLQLSLVGLLAFIMALPGALCAPLGRHLWAILAGGRRRLPAALGTLVGSALGGGLTVTFLAALAEYRDPSWLRLSHYFLSGILLGAAIGLPWLLTARFSLKRRWIVLLAGLCGSLAFFGLSQWEAWWPQHSFALSLDGRHVWLTRLVPGILIGLGSAVGLPWGRLCSRSQ